jgi:hypothetical protein
MLKENAGCDKIGGILHAHVDRANERHCMLHFFYFSRYVFTYI